MSTNEIRRRRVYEGGISALVGGVLLIGVVWNMPASPIQQTLLTPLRPIGLAAGLDQRWQMYAPDPVRRLETVEVRVTMADGGERIWTNPRGDLVVGPFTWYRWQKLKENLPREVRIRAGVAHWAVRELTEPGERATHVSMILTAQDLPAPGHDSTGEVTTETLYDEDLSGQ